jgi:hypothetical protein
MYFIIMNYIKIISLIFILIRTIFIFLDTKNNIIFYKKWYKNMNDKNKIKEKTECNREIGENCVHDGVYVRNKIKYIFTSLVLEIFCFFNPKFYVLNLLNDMKLFISMMLNLYSMGDFNEQTLFSIIKIIFDVHVILKMDLINKF